MSESITKRTQAFFLRPPLARHRAVLLGVEKNNARGIIGKSLSRRALSKLESVKNARENNARDKASVRAARESGKLKRI